MTDNTRGGKFLTRGCGRPASLPLVSLLALLLGAGPARAQTALPSLYDKWQVNLSITGLIVNSNLRIDDSAGNPGTDIDGEDDLGLAKLKLQPRGAFRWRPGRRHELEAGYQFARRTAERTLQRTIDVGDSTYALGTMVASRFDTDQAFLIYRFAFLAKERTQVGVGLGAGALFVKFDLDAVVGNGPDRGSTQSRNTTAPVGSLGLYGRFLAGDRWYFEVDARYMTIIINRFDVEVFEGGGTVRYFLSRSLGLEMGYGGSGFKVDVAPKETLIDRESFAGRIKYSLQNVRLGVVWVP